MKQGGHKRGFLAALMLALFMLPGSLSAQTIPSAQSGPTAVIQSPNKASYQLWMDDRELGSIDVYVNETGVFIPFDPLLNLLALSFYRDDSQQLYQITFGDQTTLTLNFSKNEYIFSGETRALRDGDFVTSGSDYFVNQEFLNRVFPFGFSLDQGAQKLRAHDAEKTAQKIENALTLKPLVSMLGTGQEAAMSAPADKDIAPPPRAAPRIPVIIDDLLHRTPPRAAAEPLPEESCFVLGGLCLPGDLKAIAPLPKPTLAETIAAAFNKLADETGLPFASGVRGEYCLIEEESLLEAAKKELAATPFIETFKKTMTAAVERFREIREKTDRVLTPDNGCLIGQEAVAEAPASATPPARQDPKEAVIASESGDEDNLLVLQPKIKKSPASDLFVEALEIKDKVYLPLSDMMQLLEFDIQADPAKGTAKGTFIKPENDFALDLNDSSVHVGGERYPLPEGSIVRRKDQIFVSAEEFEKWFGIIATINRQNMILNLTTETVLPMEKRLVRHQLWKKLLATQNLQENNYLLVENPYEAYAWPFVDVNIGASYHRSKDQSANAMQANYALLGNGDLGYLTTSVFANGNRDSPFNNLRLSAGRKDQNGTLLGPLKATSFSFGDISSPRLPLVTNETIGRGFALSNRALNAANSFDAHTFTGDAMPGWEVEIYRNNLLMAFQTVESNGRYEFRDIPLIYGNNVFRILLYGPQGQIEERVETLTIGTSMLKEDAFEYTFSVNQKDKKLFTIDDSDSSNASSEAEGGLRAVSEVRYGVMKNLTLGAGLAQTKIEDGDHRYVSATADLVIDRVFAEANVIKDINGGTVAGLTALTSIDDISVRMQHRQYDRFLSEAETNRSDPRKMDSQIDVNGQFYAPIVQDYNYGLKIRRETFTLQEPRLTYSSSFSKSIWGVSFSNTFNYISDNASKTNGILGLQTRLFRILVRADTRYQMFPQQPRLDGASLTAQYYLTDSLSGQTRIDQKMNEDRTAAFTQTLNWDLKNYRLSLASQYNDKDEFLIGLNLSFSLARDGVLNRWNTRSQGLASSGAISSRVFIDDNYNGRYDEGEKIVPDTRLRLNRIPVLPDKDCSFLAPISVYEPINVDIEPTSLKDPMLSPAVDGYKVVTRPGDIVRVDFPVIATSDVDGTVSIVDENGKSYEIPDIVVQLVDSKGAVVKRIVSETDGYFIFQKVRPGAYTITIPQEALDEYKATLEAPTQVTVEKTSDFYSDNNLMLRTQTFEPPQHIRKKKKVAARRSRRNKKKETAGGKSSAQTAEAKSPPTRSKRTAINPLEIYYPLPCDNSGSLTNVINCLNTKF